MKRMLFLAVLALGLFISFPSYAQECDGSPETCAQLKELRELIEKQKSEQMAKLKAVDAKAAEEKAKSEKEKDDRMAKFVSGAALLSVVLKLVLSNLKNWQPYFKSERGGAWLKAITLVVGLLTFFVSNVGAGVPIMESLILAGGAPAAIVINELMKLGPVLRGKTAEKPAEEEKKPAEEEKKPADPAPVAEGKPEEEKPIKPS